MFSTYADASAIWITIVYIDFFAEKKKKTIWDIAYIEILPEIYEFLCIISKVFQTKL